MCKQTGEKEEYACEEKRSNYTCFIASTTERNHPV